MSRAYELIVALRLLEITFLMTTSVLFETFILTKKILKCSWLTISP